MVESHKPTNQDEGVKAESNKISLLSNAPNASFGSSISKHDADETFARVTGKWNKASHVFMHDTFSSAPDYVQQEIRNSGGNEKTGGIYVDGEVHIIRDNHVSKEALERTLYHEGNHSGMVRELNNDVINKLQQAGIASLSKSCHRH